MQNERASKRQQELLSFVDGFIKGNGYGPSYREIMRALGYKSVSTVAIHIDGLIAKGYLARRDKSARSLEVVSLRADEAIVPGATDDSAAERLLVGKLKSTQLTDSQRLHAVELFELLAMPDVVVALKKQAKQDGDA
jgi:SOS-response transcriptional repressor LexA